MMRKPHHFMKKPSQGLFYTKESDKSVIVFDCEVDAGADFSTLWHFSKYQLRAVDLVVEFVHIAPNTYNDICDNHLELDTRKPPPRSRNGVR